jgi:hypothetical protein
MGVTSFSGPIITYGGLENPELGPDISHGGAMMLDPRTGFLIGAAAGTPTYGWSGMDLMCIKQMPFTAQLNNIAAPGAVVTAGAAIPLVNGTGGVGVTAATVVSARGPTRACLALDGAVAFVKYGQPGTQTVQCYDPRTMCRRNVRITQGAGDSAANYTVRGYDIYNYPMVEVINATAGATTTIGKKCFKYIYQIVPSVTSVSTAVTVGTGDVFGMPIKSDSFGLTWIYWGPPGSWSAGVYTAGTQALITAQTTFKSADPTAQTSTTGGDPRGSWDTTGSTIGQSNGTTATIAAGTANELLVWVTMAPWNLQPNATTDPKNAWQGIFGLPSYTDFN